MALTLKLNKTAVTFTYTDDNMTASWTVKSEDGEERLISTMRKVIAFVEGEEDKQPLPERVPGMALGRAQTAQPSMADGQTGNGWAAVVPPAPPELPEDRKGEWEMIPPGEQG
ncbi:hypothetical protein [Streptomyces sp. NPDC001843]|uniref:hypothetical protein n=1 Tax=Streptomyces sp. NPDC001843 TaxID=3364617 RepID=UPI00368EB4EF